jgi:hypothetical protein
MAESRQAGPRAAKEAERPSDGPNREGGSQTAQRQAEQVAELGRQGVRQAADASTAAMSAAQRSGSALNECAQEITTAWGD